MLFAKVELSILWSAYLIGIWQYALIAFIVIQQSQKHI